MKKNIIIAGVGGQGILSIAACIGMAALKTGMYLKQSEVHGMSQRGGAVQSTLRISSNEIYSDLIPLGQADLIISVEPMEALRYLPWLAEDGWLITNTTPVKNINNYPDMGDLLNEVKAVRNNIIIEADAIAREIGSAKYSNMVVLGAAVPFIDLNYEMFEDGIAAIFGKKGSKVIEMNLQALKDGWKFSGKLL
jgi:indolepyruvate ferredoxin oxidoreductase, beta subunit